ncbi:3-hydroxyacyl-CoA dehydrogenase NAD-binding domain-containing protein [Pseudorhodoplanes sp.]|uniref:3-hydroxyacyl-CoA dehydrogenase NAD-binding domain-containing protein n=1 Tax=Pseudorhodoplanes sp. TaxID=1934341 RepID=UPI002C60FF2E|nr:3-hydroxyacyl-CoA dehydrogenase NAD-binding domain-containing protein [Pseudorhodoplanes sp.]HWV51518.1 3-hydroxyacyl-CoA dehydrogenase NAD-binding domain-containing protein [Pseudorhodoplanes sp.]
MLPQEQPRRIGLVGTGSVGSGWAAIYIARGYEVVACDPSPDAETRLRAFIADTWNALQRIGLATEGRVPEDKLSFAAKAGEVAASSDFVQENAPENLALKQKVYAEIEDAAPSALVIGSSTGGIPPTQLQAKMRHPERLIVCHPFNPPHLIPLIEIIGGERTAPEVVDWALRFFTALGKKPIRVEKEVTGFLTNRLQFALLREAIHCVTEGVASPQAVEDAMRYGLGPRWAVMGALTTLTLAGGEGGMPHVLKMASELQKWMDAGGRPQVTDLDVQTKLIAAAEEITKGHPLSDLIAWRNERLVDLLRAVGPGTGKS